VTVSNPPKYYTSADFAQLLADSTGHNASLIFRLLQSQSTEPHTHTHHRTRTRTNWLTV
jgi:hypothetical protein